MTATMIETNEPFTPPAPGQAAHLLLLERIDHPDMVIVYPTEAEAQTAITDSLFIDGLCEEDCEDIGYYDTLPNDLAFDVEFVLAPTSAQEAADAL